MKWILRTAFVLILLGVGFLAEMSLQKYASQNSIDGSYSAGGHPILFIGGSVLHGIPEAVNNYLSDNGFTKKVSVLSYTRPALTSADALQAVDSELAKNKFEAVVLLIGLNEIYSVSGSTTGVPQFPKQKIEHYEQFDSLFKEKKYDELLATLKSQIDSSLHDESADYPSFYLKSLIRSSMASDNFDFIGRIKKILEPAVVGYIHDPQRNMKFFSVYVKMVNDGIMLDLILNPETRVDYFKNVRRLTGEEKVKRLAALINKFDKSLHDEITSSELSDCSQAQIKVRHSSPFEKYGICLAAFANNNKLPKDVPEMFNLQHGSSMYYFVSLAKEMTETEVEKMNSLIPVYFTKYINNARKYSNKETSEEDIKIFINNVDKIQQRVFSQGGKLVLLQPPNASLEILKQAGEDLSIPTIEDETIFKSGIAEKGYYYYFTDHAGPSGHLTAAGLNIYGPFVARELLNYLNIKNENK